MAHATLRSTGRGDYYLDTASIDQQVQWLRDGRPNVFTAGGLPTALSKRTAASLGALVATRSYVYVGGVAFEDPGHGDKPKPYFHAARYTRDMKLDVSYGSEGIGLMHAGGDSRGGVVNGMTVLPSGSALLLGSTLSAASGSGSRALTSRLAAVLSLPVCRGDTRLTCPF